MTARPAESMLWIATNERNNEKPMFAEMSRNWWMYLVRGLLAVVFGMVVLIWPEPMKQTLVLLFGVFALVDGIFTAGTAIESRNYFKQWWGLLLEGLTGIVIAALIFMFPDTAADIMLYVIAIWAIITGIFEIVSALEFQDVIPGEWTSFLMGSLLIVFGILLFVYPNSGAVAIVWALGIFAITYGILEIVFAFRLRSLERELEQADATGHA